MTPSHQAIEGDALEDLDVLVIAGVRHIERELLPILTEFVRTGGVL